MQKSDGTPVAYVWSLWGQRNVMHSAHATSEVAQLDTRTCKRLNEHRLLSPPYQRPHARSRASSSPRRKLVQPDKPVLPLEEYNRLVADPSSKHR